MAVAGAGTASRSRRPATSAATPTAPTPPTGSWPSTRTGSLTTGDLAYENGLYSEYLSKYGGGTTPQTRWGRPAIKDITLPGYGNHDCVDFGSKDGCDDAVRYFGSDSAFGTDISGTPGSYWTVKGDWLIVHLNSAGDGGSGKATSSEISAQNSALQSLLNSDNHTCELLVWHHPRYNSGQEGGSATFIDSWFDTAYANGVDVILSGHAHDYERFAPQDGNGNARSDGVREFVVGHRRQVPHVVQLGEAEQPGPHLRLRDPDDEPGDRRVLVGVPGRHLRRDGRLRLDRLHHLSAGRARSQLASATVRTVG